jgi:hypothetical protein
MRRRILALKRTMARPLFSALLAVAIAIAASTPCSAQDPGLEADSAARIRVLRIGDRVPQDARLVSLRRDTLVYQVGGCCSTDTAALSSLAAIDVSRGIDIGPERVLGGMAFGLLAGMGAGWLVGEVRCSLPDSGELCGIGVGVWMVALGAAGLITGAVWGMESKEERWERIYPPDQASLFVAPAPNHGIAFGVSMPLDVH